MLYILISRCGTDLGTPAVFSSHEKAYRAMQGEYEEWKKNTKPKTCDNGITEMSAWIQSNSGYVEWEITAAEVDENVKEEAQ